MIGREIESVTKASAPGGTGKLSALPVGEHKSSALELENITSQGLNDITLHIAPGEILGIAGVDGNGQQELAEVVTGLRQISTGRVLLNGQDVSDRSLKQRLELGIAHIPNDRKREALVPTMSVTENIVLKRHDRAPLSRAGVMSWRTSAKLAQDLTARFDIRTASVDTPVGALSGGNQQKVVLARELAMSNPTLIVAMNPARGLDVAATNFVYEQLLARRAAGAAILLISSELDELLALCDRIGVLYAGRLTMTDFPATGREEIGRLMAGIAGPA
jgi:simple sugar transport system ATP-binding protein